jgi:hypothetical protein
MLETINKEVGRMNKVRRKALERAGGLFHEAYDIITACCDEEQEYLDNMPENLRESERAEKAEDAIETMSEILEELYSFVNMIEDITTTTMTN